MSRAVPCCSRQGQCVTLEMIVKITSVTSSLASLAVLTVILIWVISDLTWTNLLQTIAAWIVEQKWDPTVRPVATTGCPNKKFPVTPGTILFT